MHTVTYDAKSSFASESNQSARSLRSQSSVARIRVKAAFDNRSNLSKTSKKSKTKVHMRDNSAASELSQNSLKKVHSFSLKNVKLKTESAKKEGARTRPVKKAKVYYVEEHVKVLSEIIAQADPILSELSSQIYQFQKLTSKKKSAKQRDIELFERYGKEDFMNERDKLNISFRELKEIESIQQQQQFKISVRNNLGLKQQDDWIYNLNIGNVMHLSLMGNDELPSIKNCALADHSQSVDTADKDKQGFDTAHELCKDAMLEKIVLIAVSYFCIATEMRFIMQKEKKNKVTKKDSEMYHAKALHICSLFLPKKCPLVMHVTQSYNKNYLRDKKKMSLEEFLGTLGIELEPSANSHGSSGDADGSFENNDIDEGLISSAAEDQAALVKTTNKKAHIKVKETITVKRMNLKP